MTTPGEGLLGFLASPLDKVFEKDPENDAKGQSASAERRKPGPHTIADNFLLGRRNWWLGFFEEHWPEIGWPLLRIRNRKTATVQAVQESFKPLEGKSNCEMAAPFWNESVLPTSGPELRKNRVKLCKLQNAVQDMQSKREDQNRACAEAEAATKQSKVKERPVVLAEFERRRDVLDRIEKELKSTQKERDALEKAVRDQEAFWYCSQLLDFLQSRRRAVDPLNLANALAGLPEMRWRQSLTRCAKMPNDSLPRFPYAVFQVIAKIWSQRKLPFREGPVEFLRSRLLALPKEYQYTREQLWDAWRDLRLAIESCAKLRFSDPQYPFSLTRVFLGNLQRQKSQVDRILDAQERLIPDGR